METIYSPKLNRNHEVKESRRAYIKRMRGTLLPNFPEEVLKEWFFRHWDSIDEYEILPFEKLVFRDEIWTVDAIPGREAFRSKSYYDQISSLGTLEWRLTNKYDWLPRYMTKKGTWNSPPIFFENANNCFPGELNSPWHLLEGHNRVGMIHLLNKMGRARKKHSVFICKIE